MNTKLYETIRSSLWSRGSARPVAGLRAYVVMLVAAVTLVVAALPAGAIDDDPPEPPPVLGCLTKVKGGMSASSPTVTDGQSVTVSWSTNVPAGCTGVTVKATGPGLYSTVRSDSKTLVPVPASNNYAMYQLMAYKGVQSWPVANVAIKVNLPAPVHGRSTVRIDWNDQVNLFVRAIGTPNTTVLLADDLNLDLSGRIVLPIARGVHIIGGRSSTKPGPRLFTTDLDLNGPLFAIGEYQDEDGVRISGVRIDGGEMGIHGGGTFQDNDPAPIGIMVNSSVNVEIANNEIYGWSGVGVRVSDTRNRINRDNASAVWIHDNYIHHNQRYRHLGYGVQTKEGAHALIERNVFDYNRHSLEASGDPGTGYRAYKNLQLTGGGVNSDSDLWFRTYTHVFDVHGALDCGGYDAYCGPAGEYFDYRYNTLLYTQGDVLKVRGFPARGAHVAKNVFVKGEGSGAISQTDGHNLIAWDNKFGADKDEMFGPSDYVCDFDGNGSLDHFLATGAAWWFLPDGATLPGNRTPYFYLNTSGKMASELTFIQENGRCDVQVNADGSVYKGGRGNPVASSGAAVVAKRTDLVWAKPYSGEGTGGSARVWRLHSDLTGVATDITVNLYSWLFEDQWGSATGGNARVLATGDFNADGATDLLWRGGTFDEFVFITLLDELGHVVVPGESLWESTQAEAASATWAYTASINTTTQFTGIGDFNADGRSDILWRKENGQMLLWFAGKDGNSALVTYDNNLDIDKNGIGHPKEVPVSVDWQVKGVGDFNGDGYSDILWRHDGGQVVIWYMVHAQHVRDAYPGGTDPNHVWEIQGVGDFDADGSSDILWRATGGELAMWFKGRYEYGQAYPTWQNRAGWVTQREWQIRAVGDFNADGRADILWRYADGTVSIWKMDGGWYTGESAYLPMDNAWQLRGLLAQAPQRIDLQ